MRGPVIGVGRRVARSRGRFDRRHHRGHGLGEEPLSEEFLLRSVALASEARAAAAGGHRHPERARGPRGHLTRRRRQRGDEIRGEFGRGWVRARGERPKRSSDGGDARGGVEGARQPGVHSRRQTRSRTQRAGRAELVNQRRQRLRRGARVVLVPSWEHRATHQSPHEVFAVWKIRRLARRHPQARDGGAGGSEARTAAHDLPRRIREHPGLVHVPERRGRRADEPARVGVVPRPRRRFRLHRRGDVPRGGVLFAAPRRGGRVERDAL
mmetsp:Transcript_11400/g.47739  ORF Transcript_11400/g.47739 Transcript_11400/m.47739 type:complete len:268 (-) Transcript_11400:521-1324(-)